MSKILYYLIAIFILAGIFSNCKEIDSTYKEFVVPGGIIYTGKAIAPMVNPGRNRVKISWLRGADPNVIKARIFWNNYMDSVEVIIPPTGDTISTIIDNLPEEFYSFFIKTYDEEGNSSIPAEVLGTVYGENYQSSLLNRPVLLSTMDNQGIVSIEWGAADVANGAFATEVIYTKTSGDMITVRFDVDEPVSTLAEYKAETDYRYRTLFLPDSAAIDTFYTEYIIMNINR